MDTLRIAGMLLTVVGTINIGAIQGAVERPVEYQNPDVYAGALLNQNPVSSPSKTMTVQVSAFSSRPEETDDTPFITASGSHVRRGVVATNLQIDGKILPFGTKIRFPELFGDEVFVVEDRMNKRFQDKVDIWFSDTHEAIHFGVKKTTIEILDVATK
jgi:3D (Asp-Asp-Asp) domain-containing protein